MGEKEPGCQPEQPSFSVQYDPGSAGLARALMSLCPPCALCIPHMQQSPGAHSSGATPKPLPLGTGGRGLGGG